MTTRHSISSIVSSRLMGLAVCALIVCASLTALAQKNALIPLPSTGSSPVGSSSPLFFYNAASGLGATALLDSAGNYQYVRAIPGCVTGWTHITGASNGALFFYNSSTGLGATALLDGAGNYRYVSVIPGFATGWTRVEAL
jgi:hypothetical protein